MILCSKNEYTKSESNSQQRCRRKIEYRTLCSKNEYTKSESNSQRPLYFSHSFTIVFKERIYKIWKQFTTRIFTTSFIWTLCSKNEYTKSESNSQLLFLNLNSYGYCVQRTNIQNLKAIHNSCTAILALRKLCSKNEYTKSESNSQHFLCCWFFFFYCVQRTNIQNLKAIHNRKMIPLFIIIIVFKERIYKIWKQFTTQDPSLYQSLNCVQRTNIQNLKAIHN